uniref:uncharacterized protein LOC125907316 n=1 Tax=Anopheles coluzzii TaxID=1518534 RepID=UPI0020FFEDB5|nr:uncharacterized protein LOC125907316 [Anopheles coluzzii]XP_049466971.1 uncharacterized protein LOC125908319 [Anopheles coluzzii]
MERKTEHDEEAGPSRESKPTTQRIPESKNETGDVVDAVLAVAARVEMIEKGESAQQTHTTKQTRGAQQLKLNGEKRSKTKSSKEKSINALVAKYDAEMREKDNEIENLRLKVSKLKRNQRRPVDNPCVTSRSATKEMDEDERSTASEDLSSGDRELVESDVETEVEEKPLTRRQESARKRLSMPLPPFSGAPEDWPAFISCFEDTTKACGFSNLENLQRLRQSLSGDALEAVNGTLMLADAVPDMIKELRNLFGKPRRILKALLRKVRAVPAPDADRLETFINFGLAVKQLVGHIVGAKLTEHLSNPLLVEELEEKLPPGYQLDWVRYKRHRRGKSLQVFSSYLTALTEDITEVKDFGSYKTNRGNFRSGTRANLNHHAIENRDVKKCYVCNSISHKVRECNEFKNLSVLSRLDYVRKNSLCENCLNNHGRAVCRFRRACGFEGCNDHHHPLLHQTSTLVEAACNAHRGKYPSTVFRTMPVTLSAGDRTYDTVAFLDEGASGTFVEDEVADALGIQGVNEPLVVSWSADVERREDKSRKIDVVLSTRGSSESFLLKGARTVEKLVLPSQRESYRYLQQQYPHLKGVPIEEAANEPVRILLGLDNLHLFAPMESKIGKPGEPIAVKSKIGWSIYGPKSTLPTKSCMTF